MYLTYFPRTFAEIKTFPLAFPNMLLVNRKQGQKRVRRLLTILAIATFSWSPVRMLVTSCVWSLVYLIKHPSLNTNNQTDVSFLFFTR